MSAWAPALQLGPYVLLAPIAIKHLKGNHNERFEQEARAIGNSSSGPHDEFAGVRVAGHVPSSNKFSLFSVASGRSVRKVFFCALF